MASRLNHEKVSRQKRVEKELREEWFLTKSEYHPPYDRWLVISFGKYKDRWTLPEIFFLDTSYFFWLVHILTEDNRRQEIFAEQAAEILHLARHILPTKRNADYAVVETRKGHFLEVRLVKDGKAPRDISRHRIRRCKMLSIDLLDEYDDQDDAIPRFRDSLHKIFFGGRKPTKRECKAFFEDPSNFGKFKMLE